MSPSNYFVAVTILLLTLTETPTILVAYQPKGNPMNEVMNKLMDLKQGIVDVTFMKKDGTLTIRKMTLNSSIVAALKKWDDTEAQFNPNLIKAWSITDDGWKAFKPHLIEKWTPVAIEDSPLSAASMKQAPHTKGYPLWMTSNTASRKSLMMQLPCSMIVSLTPIQALMLLLVSLTKQTIYAKLWTPFTETEE